MAAKPVPRTEPVPLNVKKLTREGSLSMNVADQLEGLITAGTISVGEKLPTESGLCDSFGVSRTVIREAVAHLKSLGPGRGQAWCWHHRYSPGARRSHASEAHQADHRRRYPARA